MGPEDLISDLNLMDLIFENLCVRDLRIYAESLGAILNFRQFEETHLMENAIYNELVYRGYNVDVGVVEVRINESGKRVRKQLEVDFVVNQSNKRYYIQSMSLS